MNLEKFEMYLHQQGYCTEREIKEKICRISWVETTLNISIDQLAVDADAMKRFKDELKEVIRSEEKTEDFYQALWAYYEFLNGPSEPDETPSSISSIS